MEQIEWQGGACPVGADAKVFVRCRNGMEAERIAGRLNWHHADKATNSELLSGTVHIDPDYDIVSYRLI